MKARAAVKQQKKENVVTLTERKDTGESESKNESNSESKGSSSKKITRVLATFLSAVTGNPIYITGHAIRTALKIKDACSFGLFTTLRSLDGYRDPGDYGEYMKIRLNNYSPPFVVRKACAGRMVRYTIPLYYPVAVTFDVEGDHEEELARAGEIRLGGRRGTDHGTCRITDTAVIDTAKIKVPRKREWATLVTPRIETKRWPPIFQRRKVRTIEQMVVRYPEVKKFMVYPLGTVFRLKKWFAADRFLEKEKKTPSMGHGRMGKAGFGEMYFWNSREN